jgi:hypothetical protein
VTPEKAVRSAAVSALLLAHVAAASAQAPAPPESVTVTAIKSRKIIDKFVAAFSIPTRLTGKIARWESGICPVTVGQPPALASLMTQRVKDLATSVGAPVSSVQGCTPNIEIVFTTTPQSLLDDVRDHRPDYLGYVENSSQREKLATVMRPIEAWYATETIDLNGRRQIDTAQPRLGGGVAMSNFTAFKMPGSSAANRDPIYLPYATFARVTGDRINSGLRSGLNHVLIMIDSSKLVGRKFNPLVDYVAMLALTQLRSLDVCQELPSIVNMMAPNCDQGVEAVTVTDLGYLRGLYKMDADKDLLWQRNEIANRMQEAPGR